MSELCSFAFIPRAKSSCPIPDAATLISLASASHDGTASRPLAYRRNLALCKILLRGRISCHTSDWIASAINVPRACQQPPYIPLLHPLKMANYHHHYFCKIYTPSQTSFHHGFRS
jgi:hypothetical protein